MARISCRLTILRRLLPVIFLVLTPPATASAIVRPLDGQGNFTAQVDVVNRWRDDSTLDVLVLVEVANADLAFADVEGGLQCRLRIDVELTDPYGHVITERRPLRTPVVSAADAASRTLFQNFGVVLEDVPFRSGRIRCEVYDLNQRKEGLLNSMRKQNEVSAAAGAWAADQEARPRRGLSVGDPLYLAQAPLDRWRPENVDARGTGLVHDYMHPSRRYGLEQDRLQIYVPVWPVAGGIPLDADSVGLQVKVSSLDLDFALTDTIQFDNVGRAALAAGRPAGIFYELDVNLLPEGSFLLSLGPLDRQGRGTVQQFDVVWRLAALARRPAQVRGEGRTIFHGEQLDRFLASSAADQEAMLKDFWASVNPDPESPVNEAFLEFQYRLAYVRQFLGGFDEFGAADPRGEVFLALGMPDDIRRSPVNNDNQAQDDARISVFNRFAPERDVFAERENQGRVTTAPYDGQDRPDWQPFSLRAEKQRGIALQKTSHLFGFELWEYDKGGKPLWPSRFSHLGMGQRFLFVDRTGTGDFYLESSNLVQGEE